MTTKDAKKLKVGDAVRWTVDTPQDGRVVEVGYCSVKIRWADGMVTIAPHEWDEWRSVVKA